MGGLARPPGARSARLSGVLWITRLEEAPVGSAATVVWLPEPETPASCEALPEDVAHAGRRRDAPRRAATLRRRLHLRALAARMLGCPPQEVRVVQAANAGPSVTAPRALFAGVAARAGRVIVAVSTHPVGVDVERVEPRAHRPLDLLHPSLAAELQGAGAEAFTCAWGAVEAYLKMLGVGLEGLGDVRVEGARAWRPGSAAARLERRIDGGFVHTLALTG